MSAQGSVRSRCLEKRSRALRGRNPARDIQADGASDPGSPMVSGGRVVLRHRTPEPCLKKSCRQAVSSAPSMPMYSHLEYKAMYSHLEYKASYLLRKILFFKEVTA